MYNLNNNLQTAGRMNSCLNMSKSLLKTNNNESKLIEKHFNYTKKSY